MNHLISNRVAWLLACCCVIVALSGCAAESPRQGIDQNLSPTASSNASNSSDQEGSTEQQGSTAKAATPEPKPERPALHVETFRVAASTLQDEVLVTGELRANEEVELRAESNGRIVELHFAEGQQVEAGELLVKTNDADLVAELRRVQVELKLAKQREQRSLALLEEQTLSQEVYDEARGQLDILKARIDQIEAQIDKTELRAPFRGVIGLRAVSEGSYITPALAIARLQNLDPIKLDFAVPEKYAALVGRGDSVEFTVAGNSHTFHGKVYAVEPRIDATTRTVQVRARATNSKERLLPGAFAKVKLVIGSDAEALMVPAIALIPGAVATTVYIVEDDTAQPRQVTVGQRTERQVQITAGLQAGDQVIISGIQQVRPGMQVTSP